MELYFSSTHDIPKRSEGYLSMSSWKECNSTQHFLSLCLHTPRIPHPCPLSKQPRLLACDFVIGKILRTNNKISTDVSLDSSVHRPWERRTNSVRMFAMLFVSSCDWPLIKWRSHDRFHSTASSRELEVNTVSVHKQAINLRAEKFCLIYYVSEWGTNSTVLINNACLRVHLTVHNNPSGNGDRVLWERKL